MLSVLRQPTARTSLILASIRCAPTHRGLPGDFLRHQSRCVHPGALHPRQGIASFVLDIWERTQGQSRPTSTRSRNFNEHGYVRTWPHCQQLWHDQEESVWIAEKDSKRRSRSNTEASFILKAGWDQTGTTSLQYSMKHRRSDGSSNTEYQAWNGRGEHISFKFRPHADVSNVVPTT